VNKRMIVMAALVLPLFGGVALAQVPSVDARVTLALADKSLEEIVKSLRDRSGSNIVIIDAVDKPKISTAKVSIEVFDVSWRDALELVAEVATKPIFPEEELKKLKTRELARLELQSQSPHFLANRELSKALYGEHPYNHIDTTKAVVKKLKRTDLATWHRRHVSPNNAFLVVVGDVSAAQVQQLAEHAFATWKAQPVPAEAPKAPPVPPVAPVKPTDPATLAAKPEPASAAPVKPAPPQIPLKFYGYINGQRGGIRQAFFLEGDDIFVAGENETIDKRYKVIRIGINSAVVEDTTNKNQQTLPLVEELPG